MKDIPTILFEALGCQSLWEVELAQQCVLWPLQCNEMTRLPGCLGAAGSLSPDHCWNLNACGVGPESFSTSTSEGPASHGVPHRCVPPSPI